MGDVMVADDVLSAYFTGISKRFEDDLATSFYDVHVCTSLLLADDHTKIVFHGMNNTLESELEFFTQVQRIQFHHQPQHYSLHLSNLQLQ